MPRTPPLTATLALFAFTAALAAQQRLATAGRVLDAEGKPVASATVTFVGVALPRVDSLAPSDRVVATTDEKGRFRAELLGFADYVAWATGADHASALAMDVRAGTGLEFVAATPLTTRVLRIDGLDAWPELAPLTVEVAPALPFVHAVPLVFDGGVAPMPAPPAGADLLVFVRDRAGAVLFACRQKAAPGETHIVLPPPQNVPVRVRDAAGAPVADATLRLQVAHRLASQSPWDFAENVPGCWRDVGTTGADGTAVVRIPAAKDPFEFGSLDGLLCASKPDHAASISGWNGDLVIDGKLGNRPQLGKGELPFTLQPRASFGGRVRGADGEPLAGVVLRLDGAVTFELPGLAEKGCTLSFVAQSGADGAFTFGGLPAYLQQARLVASLPESTAGASRNGRSLAWNVTALDEPLELDLRTVPLVTLRVLGTDGGPARHARLSLQPMPISGRHYADRPLPIVLDAHGEGHLRLQPGKWFVSVFDRAGASLRLVEVARDEVLDLRLQDHSVVRGSVRRPDLSPASDAVFTDVFGQGTNARDEAAVAAGACATQLNRWLASRTLPSTEGTFVLPFVAVPGFSFFTYVASPGGVGRLKLTTTDEPVEITLRR